MNAPPAVIDAPAGTEPAPSSNENVKDCAGTSESEAVAKNDTNVPSSPDCDPTGSNTGAAFGGSTVTAAENSLVGPYGAAVPRVAVAVTTSPAEPGKL